MKPIKEALSYLLIKYTRPGNESLTNVLCALNEALVLDVTPETINLIATVLGYVQRTATATGCEDLYDELDFVARKVCDFSSSQRG